MAELVDATIADWLKAGARFVQAEAAGATDKWGASARESEIVTPLALREGAEAEAARQLAFLGGPLVEDSIVVAGLRADLYGRPITIAGDRLGYGDEPRAFVIGYEEAVATDQTILTVLRRLS